MKITNKIFALPVLMGALLIAGTAHDAKAATNTTDTDTAQVDLQVSTIAEITVNNSLTEFTPARSNYFSGHMEQENGISVNVFANTGYTVSVQGQAQDATLSSDDISVKTHSVGAGLTSTYVAPITESRTLVVKGTASAAAGDNYALDVDVNLASPGAYAPGSTYSNVMVFTVTADS